VHVSEIVGKVCRPLGNTPCPDLSPGRILKTLLNPLVDQIFRSFQILLSW
jgi:hypothetical protein